MSFQSYTLLFTLVFVSSIQLACACIRPDDQELSKATQSARAAAVIEEQTTDRLREVASETEVDKHKGVAGFLRVLKEQMPDHLEGISEEEARSWACEDFCLCDGDKIQDSWKTTYLFHNIFWRYHRHPEVRAELSREGFYLATCMQEDPEEIWGKEIIRHLSAFNEFLTALSNQDLMGVDMALQILHINLYASGHARFSDLPTRGTYIPPMTLLNQMSRGFNFYLKVCRDEIIRRNNTSYILHLKHNTSLSAGLTDQDDVELYKAAQLAYRAKYGHIHTGKFKHSFDVPCLEGLGQPERSSFNWDEGGRSLDFTRLDQDTIDSLQETCEQFITMGDVIWAYNLGLSWEGFAGRNGTPEHQDLLKALHWYNKAHEFGIDSAAKKIEHVTRELTAP